MSRHLERLLRLDTLLRNPERQTASTMATVLEVSERTIRSDIEFLRDRDFSKARQVSRTALCSIAIKPMR